MSKLYGMLAVAIPLVFVADWLHWSGAVQMALACVAMVPIAGLMGQATEHLSHRVGPTLGGLLNATFGNACELIIGLMALRAGMIDVVKASITGAIIGNVLLVMGMSMVAGGLKHEVQTFNRMLVGTAYTFLAVVSFSLILGAALHAGHHLSQRRDIYMSLSISAVLMSLYFLGLLFSLKTHAHLFVPVSKADPKDGEADLSEVWSVGKSVSLLLLSTVGVVLISEHLVASVQSAAQSLGVTPVFMGVVLLAIVGNAAENRVAVAMARKNKMDLSINIVLGSSTQIAMFVAPLLVVAGLIIGQPMDLVFSFGEIVAVFASCIVVTLVLQDGKSNWLEGASLIAMYLIVALSLYFVS